MSSIFDMVRSYKFNMNQQRRKRLFKKERSFMQSKKEYYAVTSGELAQHKGTKEGRAIIRAAIIKRKKWKLAKNIVIWVVLVPAIALSILFSFSSKSDYEVQITAREIATQDSTYSFYLNSGDDWLKQNHWFNAAFEYKKAIEIYPHKPQAIHRLATAYIYECQVDSLHCKEGITLVNRLIKFAPKEVTYYELRASYYTSIGDSDAANKDRATIDQLNLKSR